MTESNPKASSAGQPPAQGRWKKRTIRILAIAGAAVIIFRLSLVFILPAVLQHALGFYGLNASYQRLSLSVLGGDLSIWDLKIRPASGGPSVLTSEYCHGNVSVLQLFAGRLYLRRVEADGAKVIIRRDAAGNGPLLHALLSQSSTTPAGSAANSKISLSSPLRIRAFRLEHLVLHLVDTNVKPAVDTWLDMNVRVSELGRKGRPTRFGLSFWSGSMLDTLRIRGTVTNSADTLAAKANIFMVGLHLKPIAGYLASLGIRPTARGLSMHARAYAQLHVHAAPQNSISMTFGLNNMLLATRSRPALSIKNLAVSAALKGKLMNLRNVTLTGCHVYVRRTAAGLLQFAGLLLKKTSVTRPVRTPHAVEARAVARAVAASPVLRAAAQVVSQSKSTAGHYSLGVEALHINNLKFTFLDAAVTPQNVITLQLHSLTAINSGGLPGEPSFHLQINGQGGIPGLMNTFIIAGTSLPFAHPARVALHFDASKITAAAIRPYLRAAGLTSELNNGSLGLALKASAGRSADGTLSVGLQMQNLRFANDGRTLLNFRHVDINSARINPRTGRFEIGNIDLSGPEVNIVREKSGALSLLGFRFGTPPRKKVRKVETAAAAATVPPRLQIDSFDWHNIRVNFVDKALATGRSFSISHAGLKLKNFLLDMQHVSAHPKTGSIQAWLTAPGLIDSASISGWLVPGANSLGLKMNIAANGMDLLPLGPYLKPRGVFPLLSRGAFQADFSGHIYRTAEGYTGGVHISGVKLINGADTLASMASLRLAGISVSPGNLRAAVVGISKPWINIHRTRAADLELLGLRLAPLQPAGQGGPILPKGAAKGGGPIKLSLGRVTVKDAGLVWTDSDVYKPVELHISADVAASHVRIGQVVGRHWSHLSIHAAIPGVVRELWLSSRFAALTQGGASRAALNLAVSGLSLRSLAPYFPRTVNPTLHDGKLTLDGSMELRHNLSGGISAGMKLNSLILSQADPAAPGAAQRPAQTLLNISNAALTADRLDPAGHLIAVNLAGITVKSLLIKRRANGDWSTLGLTEAGRPLRPTGPMVSPVHAAGMRELAAVPAFPLVVVHKLRLKAKSIVVQNFPRFGSTGTSADPGKTSGITLRLTNLELANRLPMRFLGPKPAAEPPAQLVIRGRAGRLVHAFSIGLRLRPFANVPRVGMQLKLSGIRGTGLAGILPVFGKVFDPAGLKDGQFAMDASVQCEMNRTSPIAFDFSQPMRLAAKIQNVGFQRRPGGRIWAGIKEISSDKIEVTPAQHSINIPLLNILSPRCIIVRQQHQLIAAGLVLAKPSSKTPGKAGAKSVQSVRTAPQAYPATNAPVPTAAGVAAGPATQFAIGRVVISGCHFSFLDHGLHIRIPVTGMEAEARDISSAALHRPAPIRFDVLAYAKRVSIDQSSSVGHLPVGKKPAEVAKLVTGAVHQAKPTLAAAQTKTPTRKALSVPAGIKRPSRRSAAPSPINRATVPRRPVPSRRKLFSQMAASGQLYLYPKLHGWVQGSLNGLELAEFHDAAAKYGVTLDGGVFDGSTDTRLLSPRHIDTHVKLVFTDLKLSEPAKGPLAGVLKLPTPLDVAVAAIQAPDGSITLSFGVPVRHSHISMSAVEGGVIGSLAKAIAIGIASSPLKLANGLFGGGKAVPAPWPPEIIHYAPGQTGLSWQGGKNLNRVIHLLRTHDSLQVVVRQVISTADMAVARRRANPTPGQAVELINALRRRQMQLLRQRVVMVGRLQAKVAIRLSSAAVNLNRVELTRLNHRLTDCTRAIGFLASILEPGASRQAVRRTRGVAILIAQRREKIIKALLIRSGVDHAAARVHIVFPQIKPVKSVNGGDMSLTLVRVKRRGE